MGIGVWGMMQGKPWSCAWYLRAVNAGERKILMGAEGVETEPHRIF